MGLEERHSRCLLAGEQLLVLEAADALRAQARKLGYSEREVLEVGQHFDWNDLAAG